MFTLSQSRINGTSTFAAQDVLASQAAAAAQTPAPGGCGPAAAQPGRLWQIQTLAAPAGRTNWFNVLNTPSTRTDWNQLAKQEDVDQLKQADQLVLDATGLVGGRNASPIDHLRAQVEMAEASQIRQSVADRLEQQFPDPTGMGAGGGYLADLVKQGDAQERQAFQLLQSPNPADISAGATDLKAGIEQFQLIENNWLG